MMVADIRNIRPSSEGYRIRDFYMPDKQVWIVEVSDLCENVDTTFELRFVNHHGRTDFISTEMDKNGVVSESFRLTPELDKMIVEFINKKVYGIS